MWYFQLFPLLNKLAKKKRFPMSNISLKWVALEKFCWLLQTSKKFKKKKRISKLPELKTISNQKSQTPADQQEIWVLKVITPTRTHKYPHEEQSEYTVGNGSYVTRAGAVLNPQHLHRGWNIRSVPLFFFSFGVHSNITNSPVIL